MIVRLGAVAAITRASSGNESVRVTAATRVARGPHGLRRQFGAQDLERLDRGRRRKQCGRLRHQGLRDRPAQMTLPSLFVAEGIEDGERGGPEAQCKPQKRSRLLVGEGEALAQELGDLVLLAGFGLETGEQCELHDDLLRSEGSNMEPSSGLGD